MFNYILVGGRFDNNAPKKSGYIAKLFDAMIAINNRGTLINGGKLDELKDFVNPEKCSDFKISNFMEASPVIFWMPDVSNDEEKLVGNIKKNNPEYLLVTSKNNLENKYTLLQIIAHALSIKSNLFVEFTRTPESKIRASIYDPLGNCFCISDDIEKVAVALMYRVSELLKFTRVQSNSVKGDMLTPVIDPKFFELVRNYAGIFHDLIHAENSTRLLGNASFRCGSGFPSFKYGDWVYVSKRNIDKRDIGLDGFVPVRFASDDFPGDRVIEYLGNNKPSVDTPIQLRLYKYYRNIRYMIHSHVYVDYPYITDKIIPCGALEEFYDIIKIFPNRDMKRVCINLKGHGSLIMESVLDNLENIPFCSRL